MKCRLQMDRLPTVISCCFCCFLRAGTVMIAAFSFMVGLFFAPNVSQSKGAWDMSPVLASYSSATESAVQVALGAVSIALCAISALLLLGACCNIPILIEIYQWGALVYAVTVSLMFLILAMFCFFVPPHSYLAGGLLCMFVVCNLLLTTYFILVVNSLRVSLKYLASHEDLV
ncbi:uncharacterized protein [Epargyreus clarus]|uniref:uncharacterized protein n=1 Tax=Epargyreus clarus TaxID=520877 RepID=UPI003C2C2D3F